MTLATFQIIISKILYNLINTGEVVSFIDNVIVGVTNIIQLVSPGLVD